MLMFSPSPEYERGPSLKERELLYGDFSPNYTAFSPRPDTSVAVRKRPPVTDAKIALKHKTRTPIEDTTIIYPLPSYQTWTDVGSLEPLTTRTPYPEYNSNVWQNFSNEHGFNIEAKGRAISGLVASMYPIPIPPASRMGEYTYARFIKYGDIMKNEDSKLKKIDTTERELKQMKRLHVLTEARIPPTDNKGRIIPPLALRRLRAQGRIKHRPMTTDGRQNEENRKTQLSLADQISAVSLATRSTIRRKGMLWKFSYKHNNPMYERVMMEQQDVQRWKQGNLKKRTGLRHSNIPQGYINR